jgi:TolA-binding protein
MFLGVAALFTTVWGVWSRFEQAPKRYLDMAEQKLLSDDYLGAVRDYEKITEEYSNSRIVPEAHYWVGVISHLYLNKPQKAIDSFEKTIQGGAGSDRVVAARGYLAEIYAKKLNKPKEAIAQYEKIIQESSDREKALESRYKVGELYFDLGDYEQARTEWDLLVRKNPKSQWAPAALYRQGSIYFIKGKCKEALAFYQRLLSDYPEKETSHYYAKFDMANCFEEGQRSAEALQLYKELEGHYPNRALLSSKIKRLEQSHRSEKKES